MREMKKANELNRDWWHAYLVGVASGLILAIVLRAIIPLALQ
jgi:hypothetical protein